ncbi:MAG: response regulator transcription factor [Methylotenera sp.]|nr:response regulator transcription factor [Oligoflexia bacterium]
MSDTRALGGTRVLVIEDEKSVSDFLVSTLKAHQYAVRAEPTATAGLQAAVDFRPEVVILDLGLPDMSGLAVLEKIRSWSKVSVIVLTASGSDQDKVEALDSGADDYLTKPFSVPELLARIRVALRHSASKDDTRITHGRIEIDLDGHRVFLDKRPIKLTATEFDILRILLKNSGKVVTHRTLLKEVWGPNSVEHTQYLRVYVGYLRKKLAVPGAADLIVTEPGIGYRLLDVTSD